jgi:DNA-binding CsgD family transcriptional regulator/tetratricopeptide (TPR) repeat protein
VLHGRARECGAVAGLVAAAREGRSAVLVVRGEAGVGKSALLDHAMTVAAGMTVLRASGIEAEAELPYAALHQLLRPVLHHADALPAPQSAALRGAVGLEDGQPDRFRVSLAVLSLLAEAAERAPMLGVVDDAHWLDRPSADALVFSARRLEAEGVALLFAARDGDERRFDGPGLAELRLSGLDDEAAAELLAVRAPELAASVHRELIRVTRGNPLALTELPGALRPAQRAGTEPLPDPLPLTNAVEDAYLGRIRRLPGPTRDLLEVAAAEDAGDTATVLAAATVLGSGPDALDAAERAGLLEVTERGLRFEHPLMRSAVYRAATFSRRRAAHLALAEVLDADAQQDRRVWHRAAATIGADAEVADDLERTAQRARARGGHAAAASALARAAELSLDAETRAGRLIAAAGSYWRGGLPDRAIPLLDLAAHLTVDPVRCADLAYLRGRIERARGVLTRAFDLLVPAADAVSTVDPQRAATMLAVAGLAAWDAHDPARLSAAADRAGSVDGDRPESATAWLLGVAAGMSGDVPRAVPLIAEATARARRADRPFDLTLAGAGAIFLGDDASSVSLFARGLALARQAGTPASLAVLLTPAAMLDMWTSRLSSAVANATEGIRLAELTGQPNFAALGRAVLAWVHAAQGSPEQARPLAEDALAHGVDHEYAPSAAIATWALGLAELGAGHPDAALALLTPLATPGSRRYHSVIAFAAAGDLVESAVRAGEPAAARPHVAALQRWAADAGQAWASGLAARCAALLAPVEDADGLFAAAACHGAVGTRPFEAARTQLVHGEHLRRQRRRTEARSPLRAALKTFERLGAEPWAARARGELRATGETARKRDPSTLTQLTPQELQIVRIVRSGATNREIASQLFLSPRTVDYHLRKVFGKLELSSRAELARLVLDEPD